ncbi:MAG: UxaA family hydrolase [Verrucomicrobiota bacterium]
MQEFKAIVLLFSKKLITWKFTSLMKNSENSTFLIRIHASDNILVLAESVTAGSSYTVNGVNHTFEGSLNLGHKIASHTIRKSEKVIKYGIPIGSATCDIKPGEHVHLHNMQSDYLPTYTLDEGSKFGS